MIDKNKEFVLVCFYCEKVIEDGKGYFISNGKNGPLCLDCQDKRKNKQESKEKEGDL